MTIQHSIIADPNIHEPKGVASAADGEVYIADGLGSGAWASPGDSVFPLSTAVWQSQYTSPNVIDASDTISPDRDVASGTLLFDGTVDEQLLYSVMVPPNINSLSFLRFYMYWTKTTAVAGDVTWKLEYKLLPTTEVASGGWTALAENSTPLSTDDSTIDRVLVTSLGDIDISTLDQGDVVQLRISRVATATENTYTDDARMTGLRMNFQVDKLGSDTEFA